MARSSDKTLAERMLRARERGGYRFLPFVRMNAKGYIFLFAYFSLGMTVLVWMELWPAVSVLLGLVVGACLRDLSWLIGIQRTWPFSVKVTDWEKVQKIADGLSITEPRSSVNAGGASAPPASVT
jgi:hypothetical protein